MSMPEGIARGTRRRGKGMSRSAARFIGAEIYRGSSYGAWHPLRVPRVSTVMDLARVLGWLDGGTYITSPRAKPAARAGSAANDERCKNAS